MHGLAITGAKTAIAPITIRMMSPAIPIPFRRYWDQVRFSAARRRRRATDFAPAARPSMCLSVGTGGGSVVGRVGCISRPSPGDRSRSM